MIWSSSGQCDWWISASAGPSFKAFATRLLGLSNLRSAQFSNDDTSARVLDQLREPPR
jgi:hypothetical protein